MRNKLFCVFSIIILCIMFNGCEAEYSGIKHGLPLIELDKIISDSNIVLNYMDKIGTINTDDFWFAFTIGDIPNSDPAISHVGKNIDKVKRYKKEPVTEESFNKLKRNMNFFNVIEKVGAAYNMINLECYECNFMEFKSDSGSSYALCFNEYAKLEKVIRMSDGVDLLEN